MSLNIKKDVDDKFYRYKMPAIQSKIEGKGNGIKTVIPNMLDIARALNRPPSWPTKFFGSELGAQVICDDKSNRYIVNGVHEASRLQELLYTFINKYVLCGNCGNPETDLILDDSSLINSVCKACGQKRLVENRHRLATFIQKAVPTLKAFKAGQHATASASSAAQKRELDDISLNTAFDTKLNLGDEFPSSPDKNVVNETDPYEAFGEFLLSNPGASPDAILEQIDGLGLKRHYAIAVLVQVALDNVTDDKHFMTTLSANIPVWKEIVCDDKKCQKNLLFGLERVLHAFEPSNIVCKKMPIYLQKLYEGDAVEEDAILEWDKKPSKTFTSDKEKSKAIRAHASPFIEWLKVAEECEDSE